jgi:anti-anti-sigma factor
MLESNSHLSLLSATGADRVTVTVGATVRLDGELDCSTERMLTRRITRLAESAEAIHIDARGVSFIDAAGLRTLLFSQRLAHENGVRLTLAPSGPIKRLVKMFESTDLLS